MYYSDLVKKACAIMYDAHKEDVDRGGYPYVLHPFYLATQMDDEESTCAALLHDVIEDHGDRYSFDDLVRAGFPDSTRAACSTWITSRRWRKTPSPERSSWPISGTTRIPGG